jgi:transcriptional/translational regulatory protein YebC/TACO1
MLEEKAALQTLKLLDKLEELDDVQRVFTNADFPDEALQKYRSQG